MTYEELCEGVGMAVDRKCYERIEAVYMAFDRFDSKQAIYDFYKKHDMNGIETLYKALHKANELTKRQAFLEGEISKLQNLQEELLNVAGEIGQTVMLYGISLA